MTDLIFDANSVFARSYFACGEAAATGMGAVRASLITVLSLIDKRGNRIGEHINRTLFCWDGENRRDKKREPKPQGYYDLREEFMEALTVLFGTVHAKHECFEADDVVATACYESTERQVYVVSGDKDLQQLHGGNVSYYCLNRKALLTKSAINARWNVKRPSQVALALAIIGDKVDDIPGIPKWGPAKVKKVFEAVTEDMEFDAAFSAVDAQIPDRLKDSFYSSLELILLNTQVPNVPKPVELVFAESGDVAALRIPQFCGAYEKIASQYSGDREASYDEMIAEREY